MLMESYEHEKAIRERAAFLFNQVWFRGQVTRLWWKLTRQRIHPLFITDVNHSDMTHTALDTQPIPVEQILGTNGRPDRFDRDFRPLMRRDKARWMGVASAMLRDITSLPPINVVQVDDIYYVIDGNHRVSAARALNKLYIDANVILWESPAAQE